jgi:hypothetical protein
LSAVDVQGGAAVSPVTTTGYAEIWKREGVKNTKILRKESPEMGIKMTTTKKRRMRKTTEKRLQAAKTILFGGKVTTTLKTPTTGLAGERFSIVSLSAR